MIDVCGPWVDVAFLQGESFRGDGQEIPDVSGMGLEEMAEYMARWDYGQETDDAHMCASFPWGSDDWTYEVSVGGVDYVLAVNHVLGYASLNRRPLQWAR